MFSFLVLIIFALAGAACVSDRQPREWEVDQDHESRDGEVSPTFLDAYFSLNEDATEEERFGEITDERSLADDDGFLIGPRFAFKIDQIIVTDSYLPVQRSMPLQAASGHELLVVHLADSDDLPGFESEFDDQNVTVRVVVDSDEGSTRLLDERLRDDMTIVVSVPVDDDALLRVHDGGRTQSISLRNGEHHDVVEAFYDSTIWSQQLDYVFAAAGRYTYDEGRRSSLNYVGFELAQAQLEYWHPVHGYPSEGAWLHIQSRNNSEGVSICSLLDTQMDLEWSRTLVLIDADGTEYAAEPGPSNSEGLLLGSRVIFDVPAGFRTGTLHIQPMAGTERRTNARIEEVVWTTHLPDDSISIDLQQGEPPAGRGSVACSDMFDDVDCPPEFPLRFCWPL